MKIKKVALYFKDSLLQMHSGTGAKNIFNKLLENNDITIQNLKLSHLEHTKSMDEIIKILDNLKISTSLINRGKSFNEEDFDLILTAGGDGTFLEASHFVFSKKILGINTSPSFSVGYYCGATAENLTSILNKINEEELSINRLLRLKININNSILNLPAVNDLLYTNSSPANASQYILEIEGSREDQVSSGIWIATPSGSQGALMSAGGIAQDIDDNKIQFIIREPFILNKSFYFRKGFLNKNQKLKIYSESLKACIFIDGGEEVQLKYGDRVEIGVSPHFLQVYGLEED